MYSLWCPLFLITAMVLNLLWYPVGYDDPYQFANRWRRLISSSLLIYSVLVIIISADHSWVKLVIMMSLSFDLLRCCGQEICLFVWWPVKTDPHKINKNIRHLKTMGGWEEEKNHDIGIENWDKNWGCWFSPPFHSFSLLQTFMHQIKYLDGDRCVLTLYTTF